MEGTGKNAAPPDFFFAPRVTGSGRDATRRDDGTIPEAAPAPDLVFHRASQSSTKEI